MDTIDQIRVKNLNTLIRQVGSVTIFCDITGKNESQISQIRSKNPTRKVGCKMARELECKLALEVGWMDHPHSCPDLVDPQEAAESVLKLVQDTISTLAFTEEEAEILRNFRSLDPGAREHFKAILESMTVSIPAKSK